VTAMRTKTDGRPGTNFNSAEGSARREEEECERLSIDREWRRAGLRIADEGRRGAVWRAMVGWGAKPSADVATSRDALLLPSYYARW